jgi:uncharacterized protein YkwD
MPIRKTGAKGLTRRTDLKRCMSFSRPAAAFAAALTVSLLAAPASAAGACEGADESPSQVTNRMVVRATLCVLNAKRARHGRRPLRLNRELSGAARRHSRAMARHRFFSHTSPGGASFVDRIRSTGYLAGARSWAVGENIAYGSGSRSSPRAIGRAWMNSPPHRANILSSSFREIGIGVAGGTPVGGGGATYTTDFGRRG